METNPPLRAPSAGRQFVRVYPTYPDISTLRPGVARVANHPSTFPASLIPAFPLSVLTCILLRLFLHFSFSSPFVSLSIFTLILVSGVSSLCFPLSFLSYRFFCFLFYPFQYTFRRAPLPTQFFPYVLLPFYREFGPISRITVVSTDEIMKLTSSIHHEVLMRRY